MKVFGTDKDGNLKGIVYFDKLKPKQKLPTYIKITVTQEDIDWSYKLRKDNPPSQSMPFANKLHDLGLGTLTISHQWGIYKEEIIAWLQAWERGEKMEPRDFVIETTEGRPLGVAILNPKSDQN